MILESTFPPPAAVKAFQMVIFLLWLHWHVLRHEVVVETAQASHLWVAMVPWCSGAKLPVGRLIHTCCSERGFVGVGTLHHTVYVTL